MVAAEDQTELTSPLQGTVVSVAAVVGDRVRAGQAVVVIESMKMEHVVAAVADATVIGVLVDAGETVLAGAVLFRLDLSAVEDGPAPDADDGSDATSVGARADLGEVMARHVVGLDESRPDAVAKRRRTGQQTARENLDDLLDPGSFVEYGPLVIAAQRRRRSVGDLIERTPGDGIVGGVGTIGGRSVVVVSYDYTVLAGTQGYQNHRKKDRLFELAERQRLPVVLFAEGGGGRPGDVDAPGVSGLDIPAFHLFARLSGLVPLVGIASGRCFAGNAALLGLCDVVIATEGSNIGMGGPAMIEGGGLGTYAPEDIGPLDVQVANGVVDVAVADEAEAVAVARRLLDLLGGPADDVACADQAALREAIPENRRRAYDVRTVIHGLVDTGSFLEMRAGWGQGIVTGLARVDGSVLGILANDPMHLGGALDPDGCDKAARFQSWCDAFDVPVLSLCDTPGFMVGPEVEERAQVRHAARLFAVGANITVPFMVVILRKGYGLGAMAMAGGSFKVPLFCVAWPTGEVGGMGLEGAVRLGFRKELEAIDDPELRQQRFEEMVAMAYEHGKALNSASHFEIDDVIDPADTRRWISTTLVAAPRPERRATKKRPNLDLW